MPATAFLDRLAAADRPRLPEPVVAVVAHPDDETIGFGAQMHRFDDLTIVHLTDGAPPDPSDAAAAGYEDRAAYAAARRRELEAAVGLAGIGPDRLVALGFGDQAAAANLVPAARALAALFRRIGPAVVLTHAYEGGHPDHDATAYVVDAALRLAGLPLAAIAMPLYRLGPEGMAVQSFPEPSPADRTIRLRPDERRAKRAMLAEHRSQARVLAQFGEAAETFRPAGKTDFRALPNDGRLFYESLAWGLTGADWLARVAAADRELGFSP